MSNESPGALPAPAEPTGRGVTRDQLYELAWTVPMRTLAERFSMSDRGLAKLCERHAIPVPGRGYWRRKETGHPVRRLKLPQLHPNHHSLAAVDFPEPQQVVQPRPKPEPPPDPPRVADQKRFEEANPIVVVELPERPHALVRSTRAALRKLKEGSRERIKAQGDRALDVSVTAATRDRALRILEAVCKSLKLRGLPIVTGHGDRHETQTTVFGVPISFSLEERMQRHELPTPAQRRGILGQLYTPLQERYEYVPTSELVLKAWANSWSIQRWADGKRQHIEDRLNDFMISVVRMADTEIRREEERLIRERQEQVQARVRLERERRQAEEKQRTEDLTLLAECWRKAESIRTFAAAVRRHTEATGASKPDSQVDRWLHWAVTYADRLDPLNELSQLPPKYVPQRHWETQPEVEWPPIHPTIV